MHTLFWLLLLHVLNFLLSFASHQILLLTKKKGNPRIRTATRALHHGVGCDAAAPHAQPPLPTPCLSDAAQVGSTARYSSRRRRTAAVAANLVVGAPTTTSRGDQQAPGSPAATAAATGFHTAHATDKSSAVFGARPVLEFEFNSQMSVALDSLAMHSWGISRSVMSEVTAAAEGRTKAKKDAKDAKAVAASRSAAGAAAVGAAGAATAAGEPSSFPPPPSAIVLDASTTTRPLRPPELELSPPDFNDSAPGTPRTESGTPRTSASHSVSVPFAPLTQVPAAVFAQSERRMEELINDVDQLPLTARSAASGDGGTSGGVSALGGGRRLVYTNQRPATAWARLSGPTETGAGTGTGTRGRGRPGSTGKSAPGRSPPSMTHRGQPSRPAPPPPQIMAQWAPTAGWRPGKHNAESTVATGGFKPYGATLVSGQPRFTRSHPGGGSTRSGESTSASPRRHHATAAAAAARDSAAAEQSVRGGREFSSASRRRPATARAATGSGRPVSGGPRSRVPLTASYVSPSPQKPVAPSLASRPKTSGGLVGYRGQSVGGGWYYPVVPAGTTSDANRPAPTEQPIASHQRQRRQMPPAAHRGARPASAAPLARGDAHLAGGADDVAAARAGAGAWRETPEPGVHWWSITSPWDEAAGAGALYQDVVSPRVDAAQGASKVKVVKEKSPGRTRLIGAVSLGGLPTEMDFEAARSAEAQVHVFDSQDNAFAPS